MAPQAATQAVFRPVKLQAAGACGPATENGAKGLSLRLGPKGG